MLDKIIFICREKYFSLFDWTGLFIHTMYQAFISFDLLGTHYLKKKTKLRIYK